MKESPYRREIELLRGLRKACDFFEDKYYKSQTESEKQIYQTQINVIEGYIGKTYQHKAQKIGEAFHRHDFHGIERLIDEYEFDIKLGRKD